jgi:hypothetical protein
MMSRRNNFILFLLKSWCLISLNRVETLLSFKGWSLIADKRKHPYIAKVRIVKVINIIGQDGK